MIVQTKEHFIEAIKILKSSSVIFFDVETTGLDIMHDDYIVGIGISTLESEPYYFPVKHEDVVIECGSRDFEKTKTEDGKIYRCKLCGTEYSEVTKKCTHVTIENVVNLPEECFGELFSIFRCDKVFINANVKFDLKAVMHSFSIPFNYDWDIIDTQVMAKLISDEKFVLVGLSALIKRFFEYDGYKDIPKELMKKLKKSHMGQLPVDVIGDYCCKDVSWARKIFFYCWKRIVDLNQQLIWKLEIETTKVLLHMEYLGVKFDREYCNRAITQLSLRKQELEKIAFGQAGEEFNLGSTDQIDKVFSKMGIKPLAYTPSNKPKWDSSALMVLTFDDCPIADTLLDWRSLEKLESTYFSPLLPITDDIIHGNFKNWRTATGRLSSTDPNLQNIPRTVEKLVNDFEYTEERIEFAKRWAQRGLETGKAKSRKQTWQIDEAFDENNSNHISARRLFISREDYVLFAMDFSQMEARVFLFYLDDPDITALLKDEEFDFHNFVAQEVYNCGPEHPDFKFFRQVSKEITYGIIYGMGNETLAFQMGTSVEEAKKFKKEYFKIIPTGEQFINSVKSCIEDGNEIYNMYGRRYVIPPEKSYIGINYLVQGTSADLTKERMIAVNKFLKTRKSRLLIQVHDEFILEIHRDELSDLRKTVDLLELNSVKIPLKLDVSICPKSWANKIKISREEFDDVVKYL